MRFINSLADRALGLVAPRTTAGACVPPNDFTKSCGCSAHYIRAKSCYYECKGAVSCGACYNTYITC